ncbi:hypothetical protein D3C78_1634950 [compost metagenome]
MHAQTHLRVAPQLVLHLPLVDFTVGPVLLAIGNASTHNTNQADGIGNLVSILFIGGPIGAQRQGNAVAVLAIHQHVLVHQ